MRNYKQVMLRYWISVCVVLFYNTLVLYIEITCAKIVCSLVWQNVLKINIFLTNEFTVDNQVVTKQVIDLK